MSSSPGLRPLSPGSMTSSPLPPRARRRPGRPGWSGPRSAGKTGQVTGRRPHQAHHLNRAVGGHQQLPLARSVPEAALEVRMPFFEIRGAVQTCLVGGQADFQVVLARHPLVVKPGNRHLGIDARGVDQTKQALLAGVTPRVEYRHVPPHRLPLHDIVDAGEKAIGGSSNVGKGLDVQVRLELQPPVALPASDAARQSLGGSSPLQISGAEMPRLLCVQVQCDRPALIALIVDGMNGHRSGSIGTVDDSCEPLPGRVGSRHEQRKVVLLLRKGSRCGGKSQRDGENLAEGGASKGTNIPAGQG